MEYGDMKHSAMCSILLEIINRSDTVNQSLAPQAIISINNIRFLQYKPSMLIQLNKFHISSVP